MKVNQKRKEADEHAARVDLGAGGRRAHTDVGGRSGECRPAAPPGGMYNADLMGRDDEATG